MNPRVAALVVMIAALPAMAVAQPPETNTNRRNDQRQQQPRPDDQGGQSGQQNEAGRQQRGQQYVPRTQDKAATDGRPVPRERIRTEQKQEVQTKRPHRQKQDGQPPR